ncbi:MAG TPA: class I SAM-dependent methyltransferase [Acidimicrobiales bacterium]|nr:class I SAM-dependent methyltransferase [Acidimicrobiales bacterium]
MNPALRLRRSIADADCKTSIASRARERRWNTLLNQFPDWAKMHVVDLGGTVEAWRAAPVRPGHVTLVNLADQGLVAEPWITAVRGDACEPPAVLRGSSFDLVYSNSVIEHVGGHARRAEFAEVVRQSAPRYWVQTPNRYFPVEPHFLFPGFQFLPVKARSFLSGCWRVGWYSRPGAGTAERVEGVLEIELLSKTELEHYFPDSTILRERWLALTKSLIAVR